MARYINFDELWDAILHDTEYDNDTVNHFLGIIESINQEDVEQIKHGEWIREENNHSVKYENTQITYCGLKYIGHHNRTMFCVAGYSWGKEIPLNRMEEFVKIFPETDWEDGKFLADVITDRYIRLGVKNGKVYSIKHIVKDLEFVF